MLNQIITRVRNEPVLVTTLVGAVLGLLVAFGVDLSETQTTAIIAVVVAVLAFVARQKVTPAKPSRQ